VHLGKPRVVFDRHRTETGAHDVLATGGPSPTFLVEPGERPFQADARVFDNDHGCSGCRLGRIKLFEFEVRVGYSLMRVGFIRMVHGHRKSALELMYCGFSKFRTGSVGVLTPWSLQNLVKANVLVTDRAWGILRTRNWERSCQFTVISRTTLASTSCLTRRSRSTRSLSRTFS
jgi:hypothetical protein